MSVASGPSYHAARLPMFMSSEPRQEVTWDRWHASVPSHLTVSYSLFRVRKHESPNQLDMRQPFWCPGAIFFSLAGVLLYSEKDRATPVFSSMAVRSHACRAYALFGNIRTMGMLTFVPRQSRYTPGLYSLTSGPLLCWSWRGCAGGARLGQGRWTRRSRCTGKRTKMRRTTMPRKRKRKGEQVGSCRKSSSCFC